MKRLVAISQLTVVVLAVGLAFPVAAQAPMTASDLMALVREGAQTSAQIRDLNERKTGLAAKVRDYVERRQKHDSNRCTYPQGHPEICAAYDAEAGRLDTEASALLAESKNYAAQQSLLQSHLQVLMGRIRIAPLLAGLEAWTRRVQGCASLAWEPAAGCLNAAWEEHP